jgi:hypothetical protein
MIKGICINAKNKPEEVAPEHWVKEGQKYSVTMIYNMVMQKGILGITVSEIDLESKGYNYSCFRMDRFGFDIDDLEELVQLAEDCAELNDFNVEELLTEQLEFADYED